MIRDEDRFAHMLEAIRLARESVDGLTKEQFLANPDKKAALQHYIMVVGEAANMVSDEIKAKYPGVPWREAIGMRNIIAHAYMKTDFNRVWPTDAPLNTDAAHHNILSDENPFRSDDHTAYALKNGCGRNAGFVDLAWMTDALDLGGKPRLAKDGTVDMGCYQFWRKPGLLLFVW